MLTSDAATTFVYAVLKTGIFCRPGCASRRPARANVRFFSDSAAAVRAGLRACLRCQPAWQPAAAALVKVLVAYLEQERERSVEQERERSVPLAELARFARCSPGAVQRLFNRIIGLSPRAWANAAAVVLIRCFGKGA